MAITEFSAAYHEKMFPGYVSKFLTYDPEYIEAFDNWSFDELVNSDDLSDVNRFLTILAVLIGNQSVDEFRAMVPAAIHFGVNGTQIKEMIYQAVPYLGVGPVFPYLRMSNEVLPENGYQPPLESQRKVPLEQSLDEGRKLQKKLFGEEKINAFWDSFDEDTKHISEWLSSHCFGDYYTRGGLTLGEREMITFAFLMAHGGFDEQLKSHVTANLNVGNDRSFLIKVVSQALPFIGFPAALHALSAINSVTRH